MELPPLGKLNSPNNSLVTSSMGISLTRLPQGIQGDLLAYVEKVVELSASQKQQVLSQLADLNRNPTGSTVGLETWQQQPRLKMALVRLSDTAVQSLVANTSTSANSLPPLLGLITPLPLATKSEIPLQIRPDGQLQLLSPSFSQLLSPTRPDRGSDNSLSGDEKKQLINQGLRQYMAYSQPAVSAHQVLQKTYALLAQLPSPQRAALIPANLQQAMHTLTKAAPQAGHALSPQAVKSLVENSGNFLEARLAQAAVSSVGTAKTVREPVQQQTPPSATVFPTVQKDTKLQLLTILDLSSQQVAGQATASRQPAASLASQLSQAATVIRQSEQILGLLKNIIAKPAQTEHTVQIKERLLQLIQSAAALGIAGISTRQLQQLAARAQEPGNIFQFSFDWPGRNPDNPIPVFIYLQEKLPQMEENDKERKKGRNKKQRKQWLLYMKIELPDDGWLATELSLCEQKLKTRLWAGNQHLKDKTKERLSRLRQKLTDSGLEVEDLVLESGHPPEYKAPVAQQLVDIET